MDSKLIERLKQWNDIKIIKQRIDERRPKKQNKTMDR